MEEIERPKEEPFEEPDSGAEALLEKEEFEAEKPESELDLDSLEAIPEGREKEYLVDLIDQPAWKSILIGLVKGNKMDPWNIDVIALANLYWKKIQLLERQDLRVPANAILASAILLKMKARTIKLSSVEEEEEEETKEISPEELAMIEESVPELRGQRQFREGKISLDELVNSIGEILEKTKQKKSILRDKALPDFSLEFNKEKAAEQVDHIFKRIKENVDSQGIVAFSSLLEKNTAIEMVYCFMPILYLTNNGRINAWQEEWFGEIFISLIEEGEEKPEAK